jgi:chemotaxis protein CheZ
MSTQAKLGDSLLKNLMSQREQKGELSLEDVGSILQQVASDFTAGVSEMDVFLREEITRMAEYIDQAKKELADMMKDGASGTTHKVNVSEQLDAVVKATEHASNEIMNVADAIQAAAAGIGGEKEQQLMDAATKLYEACSFQDLTGQRINKVISIITYMDEKLHAITHLFSKVSGGAKGESATIIKGKFDEKELLNGPQLAQPTQADIDALFGDFKA